MPTLDTPQGSPAKDSRSSREFGHLVSGRWIAFGVAAWIVIAIVMAVAGVRSLGAGLEGVTAARRSVTPETLQRPSTARDLAVARRRFVTAERLLGNPVLVPLRFLPVAGRQLRSVHAMSGAARDATAAAEEATAATRELLARRPTDGPTRAQLVTDLVEVLATTEERLASLDLGPNEALIGPLGRRRDEFAAEIASSRAQLQRGVATTTAVRDLIVGPRRYLLLAANNAEMRAGSGMFLSAGVLQTDGGHFTVSAMERTSEFALEGEGVPIEGDLLDRWGFVHPNREWRNLGVTPRFDETGALAARMWQARTGQQVDGVLAVDVMALASIVEATGPVRAAGKLLDAKAVPEYLLHDQYVDIPASGSRREAQADRRDELATIVEEATSALQRGDFDATVLAQGIFEAAMGRHLLLWSARPEEQRGWVASGAAGHLQRDSLLVSVLNRAGNKLDRFVRPQIDLETSRGAGGVTSVAMTIRLRNSAGESAPPYVAGPAQGVDAQPGEYIGLVAVNMPGPARLVSFEGGPLVTAGRDGPTVMAAVEVGIPRGDEAVVTLRFELPQAVQSFEIEPSARYPSSRWRHRTDTWTDGFPRRVRL